MKSVLICALILLMACSVSANTIILTDGQKIEAAEDCNITSSGFVECRVDRRTSRIPVKAIKQITRNDGTILSQTALVEHVKTLGRKAVREPESSASGNYVYTPSVKSSPSSDTDKPVHVKGYTKKDGTYVEPYTRSRPSRSKK